MISAISSSEGISLSNFDNLVTQYSIAQLNTSANDKNSSKGNFEEQKNYESKKAAEKKANYTELANSIKTILDDKRLAIEFARDKETNEMVMKIINDDTKEVIRQYPAEISLKIARIVTANLEAGNITNMVI